MKSIPSNTELVPVLDRLGGRTIGVIGDVILDQNFHGRMERLSPEAPIPIVDVEHEVLHLGGAANVAGNITGIGDRAALFSVVGDDRFGHQLIDLLGATNGLSQFVGLDGNRRTTVKQRHFVDDRQIWRADFETLEAIGTAQQDRIMGELQKLQTELDALILEDYDKGVLNADFIAELMKFAQSKGIMTFIDPKFDNFFDYKGATVFKPNLREASMALGRTINNTNGELEACCRELQQRLECENVVLTLSKDGIAVLDSKSQFAKLPAMIRVVHDSAGAGDTVISVVASAMAAGGSVYDAVALGNLAAGAICEKVGVQPVSINDVRAAMEFFSTNSEKAHSNS